ncbi:ArsR/SmtB family transcription factor [Tsukamurella paurometabola]|uniref:Regulatory protein ArsR n=1 Tax=Tsukamurella paurometabola (strain ATCC 8368 / DSM 20162 / CCUG 35730 / CIP 100753 / JCM 10117 / KCTC 9821 / NBRC 16120 / NCIMB 702349 / NCTC 13040) TaxID=521096 RepID=D5URA9_TSUPD|nr:winged helix-turn-helix domain-containing protein [Tsukamurella paurometabola]ADG76962.1 regulatory protein ArsR [Tsukamurella paurometabola DSM 20162]
MSSESSSDLQEVNARLEAIEQRLHALEASGDAKIVSSLRTPPDDAASSTELPLVRISNFFSAIGNPTRLSIIRALAEGAKTPAEILSAVEIESKGKMYHHLRTLTGTSILARTAGGAYQISSDYMARVIAEMSAVALEVTASH